MADSPVEELKVTQYGTQEAVTAALDAFTREMTMIALKYGVH